MQYQSGGAEVWRAHNPQVRRSKPGSNDIFYDPYHNNLAIYKLYEK